MEFVVFCGEGPRVDGFLSSLEGGCVGGGSVSANTSETWLIAVV